MAVELRVPTLGESVSEATVATWFKKPGDRVAVDEMLCELETDKVTVEVPSPVAGKLAEIVAPEGAVVAPNALLAQIMEQGDAGPEEMLPKADAGTKAQEGQRNMSGKSVDVMVPTLGESVTEATVATWFKKVGDSVAQDEMLCELETDKVSVEVPAPAAGVLAEILAPEGATVDASAKLAIITEGAAGVAKAEAPAAAVQSPGAGPETPAPRKDVEDAPSAKKAMAEAGVSRDAVTGTGRDGRVMKEDVARAASAPQAASPAPAPAQAPRAPSSADDAAREERVKMTRLRATIARRLKDAQNTAAMLTTYNEVDMKGIMDLRNTYKDQFEKKHKVKLGFMSFFVKACCHALKEVPEVNAEIDGGDVVYKNFVHMGVAVGTPNGLVVPVVRDADQKSFARIEKEIAELGTRARDGKLTMAEMQGGTFTISNGGVYGSLMSSPILNPPQSGILGMHKIQDRPVVVDGQIVIRPMMYLALSYDHRIVDGKGAVTFLVRVKEALEDPRRLLMDL
ncbi:2-oxoglutarate dehydrogenase complex dihydrolipoyllysine-residue succinyltransferase [Paracoccus denitrificans]|jgi:2-oxoglutarate dehydrogenase E2 component (dihydrolipoamide succinyltransferase)|uniref:Dihydrolipoyllysine-residue succinyltransferase component of 2-oxoglutarate dehydrogenase complex n=1 Tax=Paracoccus denitrificans (strain Pd 1222) TaxID=318586 RepID=A1AZH2_PARDP|nr:2-oxoglutarate dehydrogenase complex dihydrolipoyllysine-residue succinyltransferase [Paracoccus denitrificans]ABL68666.1 2-oxoglutarate dehydrogenase E2 component [Paracoccus denitrificans PD1222]MBB4625608.1 2-oxoglutarate dehydrogenase E2 component (dihydrolipoamide succinyltransferase) [Paracoccus denitrificans]MCU7427223.1 2-oxoglutarate dehydrogenase complex dihydrolipoyllysine-residue succinyltransferase [Paracoccus denitrificans]QAR26724.1 2-oxoglutarate dehydrogenase complex dihydro